MMMRICRMPVPRIGLRVVPAGPANLAAAAGAAGGPVRPGGAAPAGRAGAARRGAQGGRCPPPPRMR